MGTGVSLCCLRPTGCVGLAVSTQPPLKVRGCVLGHQHVGGVVPTRAGWDKAGMGTGFGAGRENLAGFKGRSKLSHHHSVGLARCCVWWVRLTSPHKALCGLKAV